MAKGVEIFKVHCSKGRCLVPKEQRELTSQSDFKRVTESFREIFWDLHDEMVFNFTHSPQASVTVENKPLLVIHLKDNAGHFTHISDVFEIKECWQKGKL